MQKEKSTFGSQRYFFRKYTSDLLLIEDSFTFNSINSFKEFNSFNSFKEFFEIYLNIINNS